MQQSTAAQPSPPDPSFAGLFAALASPEKKFPPKRDDDGLADDIATLSYEHALRTHARYQSAVAQPMPADSPFDSAISTATATAPITTQRQRTKPAAVDIATASRGPSSLEESLKRASITIRLSETECAQLRRRASDAGLTVSAYLRSCTFEAENLRALVKDTLAQLRTVTGAAPAQPVLEEAQVAVVHSEPKVRWWQRLFWPFAFLRRRPA